MKKANYITEYFEDDLNTPESEFETELGPLHDFDDFSVDDEDSDDDELMLSFTEPEFLEEDDELSPPEDEVVFFSEEFPSVEDEESLDDSEFESDTDIDAEPVVESVGDLMPDENADLIEFSEEDEEPKLEMQESNDSDNYLPGSTQPIEQKVQEEPEVSSWENDRDPEKFFEYLISVYPANIPKHDGNSISGCEKAYIYLNELSKEISEAIRKDHSGHLNDYLPQIENIRVEIMRGMTRLKERISTLKQRAVEFGSPKAVKAAEKNEQFLKEGSTPVIQLVMTPFERAITGILVNSVISAGHPFEDVYEYLKEKFKLTEREELAILQLVMDMGFPIFKDRGTIGNKNEDSDATKQDGHGIDFIKNYFA